ncbi:MAG: NifB/NifX family molybdenum-iron cluster-binding protein [Candidatus Bathyarchaeia archaeon]
MKICITTRTSIDSSTEPQELLNSQVDPRFGRCESFVIINTENMEMEVIPNTSAQTAHGAGVQAAQTIANQNVEVVITGKVGPNAYEVLSTSGIKIVTGAVGTIGQVIEQYKSGQLQEDSKHPNVSSHFGQDMKSVLPYSKTKSIENLSLEDELSALEEDKNKLADELESVKARIKELKDLAEKNS